MQLALASFEPETSPIRVVRGKRRRKQNCGGKTAVATFLCLFNSLIIPYLEFVPDQLAEGNAILGQRLAHDV